MYRNLTVSLNISNKFIIFFPRCKEHYNIMASLVSCNPSRCNIAILEKANTNIDAIS